VKSRRLARGVSVPQYRVYLLDVRNGFVASDDLSCGTDEEALARAADLLGDYPSAEVWDRVRFVGKVVASSGNVHEMVEVRSP
jgi:hypothetical protein